MFATSVGSPNLCSGTPATICSSNPGVLDINRSSIGVLIGPGQTVKIGDGVRVSSNWSGLRTLRTLSFERDCSRLGKENARPLAMRIPRSIQLFYDSGFVHKFWRCHNREFYFQDNKIKRLYLSCTRNALKEKKLAGSVKLHSYCAMDNHFHKVMSYEGGSKNLSEFMRLAHSSFGRLFNKLKNRSGKVAEGRPRTPLIENHDHMARVQFYVEANPVRAGKVELNRLKYYKYSTYQYYAYGIKNEFHDMITEPDWYRELGSNSKERQKEYRRLFLLYLDENKSGLTNFLKSFIGSSRWVLTENRRALAEITGQALTSVGFDST